MKFLSSLLFLCTYAISFTQDASPANVNAQDTLLDHVRKLVQREFDKENYPGLSVAVYHQGDVIWSEGFGFANIEDSIRVDPSRSLFRIGSVSKTLTAAGLAKLVEQGKFDLDAPIQKYVPDFPVKRWPLTTRQVANHTAGIRHYRGFEFFSNTNYSTVREALEVFMHDTLLFEPGEKFSYSSYGWNLVSAAMEGAADVPFTEFMRNEIFIPANMYNTFPDDIRRKDLPRVGFYDLLSGQNMLSPPVDNSIKWAGGGFLSTTEDLIKFGIAILNHQLVNEVTQKLFWTPPVLTNGNQTNYGLGWATHLDKHDRRWVGHSGGSVGGASMFLVYPEENLIVVTLINRSGAKAQDLAFTIADQFLKS